MKHRAFPLLTAAFWQLARFGLIGFVVMEEMMPDRSIGDSLMYLWLPSSQLMMVAALVLLAVVPGRAVGYRRLAIFGKVFDILPGTALLIFQARAVFFGAASPLFRLSELLERIGGGMVRTSVLFYFFAVAVVMLDLIALLVVVSCRSTETAPSEREVSISDNLPDFYETHLED